MPDPDASDTLIAEILANRKYRELGIPTATLRDLLEKELPNHRSPKDAVKAVRRKLHNIVAGYLGDPDYASAGDLLEAAFQADQPEGVKAACASILARHASSKERLAILADFYPRLFALTGQPRVILDLACGLNPFTLPWMGLPLSTRYQAFDIHRVRVQFINDFLTLYGMAALAEVRDILIDPPIVHADMAFFFKEAHRLEQRRKGANRELWQSIDVNWLIISLPITSLSGQHDLSTSMRQLVYKTVKGFPWQVQEIEFENELVFCIKK
jgi:16S rRNA (guanine(1405)-N(7))-methyltransferase